MLQTQGQQTKNITLYLQGKMPIKSLKQTGRANDTVKRFNLASIFRVA